MQDNETSTWLARDGDGRILEVDPAGYPGAEAESGDERPVTEATDSPKEDVSRARAARAIPADTLRARLAAARAEYADRTGSLGPCGPGWGAAERDWEAEAGC